MRQIHCGELFTEIKRLKRPKSIYKSGKRGPTSAGDAVKFERWVAVRRQRKAKPTWLLGAVIDKVAADMKLGKTSIRDAYLYWERRLGGKGVEMLRKAGVDLP